MSRIQQRYRLFDTDSAGTITWKYVWGAGTDNLVAVQSGAGAHYYAVTDQLGSVRILLTRAGTWTMRLRYRPYGALLDSAGPGLALRYRWTGREWDGELGWYFHRARYYAPALSRFVQEDPIAQAGGPNLYAYVGGAPLERRDPSGLIGETVQQGGFSCGPTCYETGVYLDGVWVKNGDRWLTGMPGLGFAGYASPFSASSGASLANEVWSEQVAGIRGGDPQLTTEISNCRAASQACDRLFGAIAAAAKAYGFRWAMSIGSLAGSDFRDAATRLWDNKIGGQCPFGGCQLTRAETIFDPMQFAGTSRALGVAVTWGTVLTHEAGHVVGTMNQFANGGRGYCGDHTGCAYHYENLYRADVGLPRRASPFELGWRP